MSQIKTSKSSRQILLNTTSNEKTMPIWSPGLKQKTSHRTPAPASGRAKIRLYELGHGSIKSGRESQSMYRESIKLGCTFS